MKVRIALAGNPNCGKTTLFNALTGANQFVGNWPGVTVEKKEGKMNLYTPLVTQEEVQAKESDEFVERTFSGSLPGFLTAFLGNKKLSGKEAEKLKKLIDEYRED